MKRNIYKPQAAGWQYRAAELTLKQEKRDSFTLRLINTSEAEFISARFKLKALTYLGTNHQVLSEAPDEITILIYGLDPSVVLEKAISISDSLPIELDIQ